MTELALQIAPMLPAQLLRARLFENLGYALILVSVLVLATGIAWSVQRGLDSPARGRFVGWSSALIALLAFGGFAWLAYSVFGPAFRSAPITQQQLQRLNQQQQSRSGESAIQISVQLTAEQMVVVEGREVLLHQSEPAFSELANRMRRTGLSLDSVRLVIAVDPQTTLAQAMQLVSIAGRCGFQRYKLEIAQ